jgi:transcription-repair coupling factor (superfamily II helicase)
MMAADNYIVPVHQADRLTRYVGAEGVEPALDRLGGQEWHEKKSRVKEAVLEVAQEMLDLYARRKRGARLFVQARYAMAKGIGRFVSLYRD